MHTLVHVYNDTKYAWALCSCGENFHRRLSPGGVVIGVTLIAAEMEYHCLVENRADIELARGWASYGLFMGRWFDELD